MPELTLGPTTYQRPVDRSFGSLSLNPQAIFRKLMFIGILFLFSGTHNVLTILAPGGAAADTSSSPDVTVGGVPESDAIPGPLKTVVWCVVGIALAASQIGNVLRLAAQMPFLSALGVLGLISTLWSMVPAESLSHGLSLLLTTLVAYFFTIEFDPDGQMEIVIAIGWVAAIASTGVAVFLPQYGVDQVYNLGEWRGIYAQKNACAAAMLLFLGPLFARKQGRLNTLTTIYGLGILFVLFKTQSRNGWVAGIALIATMLLLRLLARFKVEDRRALFTMVLWFVGACGWILSMTYGAILSALGRDPTFTGRTGIWDAAVTAIRDRPVLGYGFCAFWAGPNGAAAVLYGEAVIKHAHDGLLELGLGMGLIGVAIFLISLGMVSRDIATCLRPGRPPFVDWYTATIIAVAYFSVAEPFLVQDKSLSWVLYVVASVGLRRQAQQYRRQDEVES